MKEMASLQEIELHPHSIFIMHEKCEKYIAFHKHGKNQLTYVEGGLAYLRLREKLFVIPARHYFWLPAGVEHTITVGNPATVCRTMFFHTNDRTNLWRHRRRWSTVTDQYTIISKQEEPCLTKTLSGYVA